MQPADWVIFLLGGSTALLVGWSEMPWCPIVNTLPFAIRGKIGTQSCKDRQLRCQHAGDEPQEKTIAAAH